MKLKKKKKVVRMRGHGRGTHGWGARKKHISSGHAGGTGMSGTGKMGGHKKTMVLKMYGNAYFGKQGVTSRGTKRKKNRAINLEMIEKNLESLKKEFLKNNVLDLTGFKILGKGEIKTKLTIKADAASESAKAAIEKVGGKLILPVVEKSEKKEEKVD